MQAGGKYPLNVCKCFIAWKTLPDQRWADTLCPRIPQGGPVGNDSVRGGM